VKDGKNDPRKTDLKATGKGNKMMKSLRGRKDLPTQKKKKKNR